MSNKILFEWIQERYPDCVSEYRQTRQKCNNLFIDLDSILQYIPPAEFINAQTVFSVLDELIQLVNPQKLIYISLSGAQVPAFMNVELQANYQVEFEEQQTKQIPFTQFQQIELKYSIIQYISKQQSTDFPLVQVIFDDVTTFKSIYKIQKFIRSQALGQEYNIVYSNNEQLVVNILTQPSLRQTYIIMNKNHNTNRQMAQYTQIDMCMLKRLIVFELKIADHEEIMAVVQVFYFLFNPFVQIPILTITRDNLDRFIDRMNQRSERCQYNINFIQWFIQKFNLQRNLNNTNILTTQQNKQLSDQVKEFQQHQKNYLVRYEFINDLTNILHLNEKTQTLQYFVFMYGIYDYIVQNDQCVQTPQYDFCNAPDLHQLTNELNTYNLQLCQQMEEKLKQRYISSQKQSITQLQYLLNTQTLSNLIKEKIINKDDAQEFYVKIYIYLPNQHNISEGKVIVNMKEFCNIINAIQQKTQSKVNNFNQKINYQIKYQLFSQFQTFYGIFVSSINKHKVDNYKFIKQKIKFNNEFLYIIKQQDEKRVYSGVYQSGDAFLQINEPFTLKTNLIQKFNITSKEQDIIQYIRSNSSSVNQLSQQYSHLLNQSVYCYFYYTQNEEVVNNYEYVIDEHDQAIIQFNKNKSIRNLRQEQIWTECPKSEETKFSKKQLENPKNILYIPPISSVLHQKYRDQLPEFGLIMDFK